DERGRLLFCGEVRAGSVADITQARDAGLVDLLADTIDLQILADAGVLSEVTMPTTKGPATSLPHPSDQPLSPFKDGMKRVH
ncbi:hypothetical protein ABZ070_37210, partial [Streptomyces sp. NPDC006283]